MSLMEQAKKQLSATSIGAIILALISASGNYFQHKERMLEIQLRHEAEKEAKSKREAFEEQSQVIRHFQKYFEGEELGNEEP